MRVCRECARNKTQKSNDTPYSLLPAIGPLEFVAMAFLRSFSKTLGMTQFVLLVMDCYIKLTRDIPTSRTTASIFESLFLDSWVILYWVPKMHFDGQWNIVHQPDSESLCASLATKNITGTVYHLQTSGHAEILKQDDNRMIVSLRGWATERLRHLRARMTPAYNDKINR